MAYVGGHRCSSGTAWPAARGLNSFTFRLNVRLSVEHGVYSGVVSGAFRGFEGV